MIEYKTIAAGYLVRDGKVLLVHHNGFDKWVPPGGHIEPWETPADAVVREFEEETGLIVEPISVLPTAFVGDSNSTPISLPFHMDIETEAFDSPRIGYFYYLKEVGEPGTIKHQEEELYGIDWFGPDDLQSLQAFDQVRALAKYAIDNYPKE